MTTVFWAHLAAMEHGEGGEMGSRRRGGGGDGCELFAR
jgi:hypothetical protein